jgi:molybdate transport system substrate-binding protein
MKSLMAGTAAAIFASIIAMATPAKTAEISIMTGGAPREAFKLLTPQFEKQTGHKVTFIYVVTAVARERLAAGEKTDIIVMPVQVLDGYAKEGKVRPDSTAAFGTYGLSVLVKEGAARPDISTKDAFRATMLSARSVAHSPPGVTPSGTHMAKVMEQLGIADAMAKKVIHRPVLAGGAQLVASGEAEIGIYATGEVTHVKGITIVGPLPAGLESNTVYEAGISSDSAVPEAAAAFIKFMAAPENRTHWKDAGFEPL